MPNWESLIAQRTEAHRDTYKPCTIEDASERNIKLTRQAYERTEAAKTKHRAWNKTPAGKASSKRRTEKYRKAHPERVNAKSRRFYARHKDEPEFKARKREYGRRYRQAHHDERLAYERKRRAMHREEIREYMRQWKIAHSTGKSQFACKAYTITLHEIGQMTVHIVTTKAA